MARAMAYRDLVPGDLRRRLVVHPGGLALAHMPHDAVVRIDKRWRETLEGKEGKQTAVAISGCA
eukprot:8927673-Alexandrium_andersonii.AAC.1